MLSFTRKCNDMIKLRSLLSFWALSNWLWHMPSRGLHNLDNFEYYYKLFLHCKKIQVFLKIFRLIWNVMTAASKCSVVCMSISSCVCNRYWTFSEDKMEFQRLNITEIVQGIHWNKNRRIRWCVWSNSWS